MESPERHLAGPSHISSAAGTNYGPVEPNDESCETPLLCSSGMVSSLGNGDSVSEGFAGESRYLGPVHSS